MKDRKMIPAEQVWDLVLDAFEKGAYFGIESCPGDEDVLFCSESYVQKVQQMYDAGDTRPDVPNVGG